MWLLKCHFFRVLRKADRSVWKQSTWICHKWVRSIFGDNTWRVVTSTVVLYVTNQMYFKTYHSKNKTLALIGHLYADKTNVSCRRNTVLECTSSWVSDKEVKCAILCVLLLVGTWQRPDRTCPNPCGTCLRVSGTWQNVDGIVKVVSVRAFHHNDVKESRLTKQTLLE